MKSKSILFIIFSVLVFTKLIFSTTINSPHIVLDESLYFIESNKLWNEFSYFTDGYGAQYPPLYPLLISIGNYFEGVLASFKVVLLINAFVSTVIIFPTYYLAREWLDENKSLVAAFLVGIIPASFIYSFTAMSENLFFLLFLFSVYFMKKVLDDDSFRNNILLGIFISLTTLTKLTGAVLIIGYGIIKLHMALRQKRKELSGLIDLKNIISFLIILIPVGTYFLLNSLHYGTNDASIILGYDTPTVTKIFIPQLLAQTLYLGLAVSCIGFMLFCSQIKRFNFFGLLILISFIFIALVMPMPSVHGRYVDILIPLLIIAALGYERKERSNKYLILSFGLSMMSLPMLCMFYRDTINSGINIYTFLPSNIIFYVLLLLVFVSFLFVALVRKNKIAQTAFIFVLLVLFISGNVTNFQYLNQASDNAFEYCTIGHYIDIHTITNLTFNKNDVYDDENWWASYCLISYYNREVIPLVNNSKGTYYITSRKIPDREVLAKQKRFKNLEEGTGKYLYLYEKRKS